MRYKIFLIFLLLIPTFLNSQSRGPCDDVDHGGADWTITSNTTIGGRHYNIGTFTINSGVIVSVDPSCHMFTIEAVNINIAGTINADGAGETGGNGGIYRGLWDSKYGTGQGILNCKDKDDCYQLKQYGGTGGGAGNGTGGGNAGSNGGDGTGFKQKCQNVDDGGGEVDGSGGGGGGAGGSYGGSGGSGGAGGSGGEEHGSSIGDNDCDYMGSTVGGGGTGGSQSSTYGNSTNENIEWGSGGGGAGGGGRGAACYPSFSGTWQIYLYDSYGDGWDNAKVSVAVNGVNVLTNVTLSSGYGPAIYNFTVSEGQVVTITYTAGTYPSENYYYIYTNSGALYYSSSQPPLATYQFTVPTAPANRTCYSNGGNGGTGGGAVKLIASNNLTLSGTINANGTNGGNGGDGGENTYTSKCCDDWDADDDERTYSGAGGGGGGAGGGAGGGVMIKVEGTLTFTGTINAKGGNGGNGGKGGYSSREYHGYKGSGGAGGGGGRIKIFVNPCANNTLSGTCSITGGSGGSPGSSGAGTGSYGNDGSNGTYNVINLSMPYPTVTASASPSSICIGGSSTLSASGANNYTWSHSLGSGSSKTVAPTSTTTYSVTGTNQYGCTGTATVSVTVNPLPSVTASASPAAICNGATSVLTASGANTYNWSGGLGSGASKTVTPSATTTYTVTGTSPAGCTGTATVSVTVNPLPSVSASASPAAICNGATSVLTASSNITGTTYSWNSPLGEGSSKTVTPTSTSSYTVTGMTTAGCTGTATVSVTVNPLPTVTATASPAAICNGATSVLTASSDITGTTYSWNTEGNTASITVTPSATTTYTVTGTTGAGCSGTATVSVTVNPLPSVTATASSTEICLNGSSILTASSDITGTTYSWNTGGNTATITVTPSSTTTYSVTGTSTEGCTGTATVSVTVNPLPTVSATASSTEICLNGSSILTASSDITGTTYSWNSPLGAGSSKTVTPTSTSSYTVTAASPAGCTGTATVSVTVNPLPLVSATASPSEICNGATSVLTASSDITGTTYSWNSPLGAGSTKTVTPTSTSSYTVTGMTTEGCTGTATVSVTVNPLPTVTASASPAAICNGATSVLTASGANTYNWSHSLGSGSSKTVSPTGTTTYTVTGITSEGCSGTAAVSVTVNPLPTVTASASPAAICNGATSVLTASGANTYNWSHSLGSGSSKTVSPTGTTTYTVTGITSEGCSGTATVSVTVNPLPTVTATASPNSVCLGNSSILTANSNITGTTFEWSGTLGTGSTKTITPISTTTYSVTGTTLFGCSSSTSITITVNALPSTSITTSNETICNGESSILMASGADFYSWSHNLGTGLSQMVSPTSTTTYTVTGYFANGCSSTASIQITVNPIPYIIINASNNPICFGDSTTLNVIGDAMQYSWSHNLGTNINVTVSPLITTTYSITGTNEFGCTSSANITITVNHNADATIKPVPRLCDNSSTIILNATDTGGVWSGDGIINETQGLFSPIQAGVGEHIITYTISGQCGDTDTITITVYPSPDATAYATDETCIDAYDGKAWVEVSGGTPPYAFLWSTYHTLDSIANLAPGEYYVTATDFHNCLDKDTVLIKPGTEDCYITHIYVPNIFAPDGRGNAENEYLRVYGKGIETIDFTIFDRFGNEVFHSTDINMGWDGTYKGEPALVGDYTYVIKISYLNGKNESLKGHIFLIR